MDLGKDEAAPPPPPSEIPKTTPATTRLPMARVGLGTKGQNIIFLTNHSHAARLPTTHDHFYQYTVKMTYEDGTLVEEKGIRRKVVEKLHETYRSKLAGKKLAYDGDKTLFTLGSLPHNKLEFDVVLEEQTFHRRGDNKRFRGPQRSKQYKVEITYATKIPLEAKTNALRVFDILLRQHAAKKGCLLVQQSYFYNEPWNFTPIGGGVLGCRGFHSSFRATQGGLYLNIDLSTTMVVQPGPVMDFILSNQNVDNPDKLDWIKAKTTIKNLRFIAKPSNREFKITGLSDKICQEQLFELKERDENGESKSFEITVYDYFVQHRKIKLKSSGNYPCINVGKPNRPTYFPIELCELVSLQRYTNTLSESQKECLVQFSRPNPLDRMEALAYDLKRSNYSKDPLFNSFDILIDREFAPVKGRVLRPPVLKIGNRQKLVPQNGQWNFNNRKLFKAAPALKTWIVVNFSARVDIDYLIEFIIICGQLKGMEIHVPCHSWRKFDERPENLKMPADIRVEKMIETIKKEHPNGLPMFILCILPKKKNCDIYGPWKRTCLVDLGIVNQCISPTRVLSNHYLSNVLLKINAKLGGLNSQLTSNDLSKIRLVFKTPTLIVGMDVSHGSPGRADIPSIAAVVGSRKWPSISYYRASVRTQSPKVEMIDGLFKPVPKTQKDDGMFRELLDDFLKSSGNQRPKHIIIFRDGVSESQFSQVLNFELDQIKEACKFFKKDWSPKFTLIVAQKNHHTKFFLKNSTDNVPPGTVVDNIVCHPKNYDFYMCSHAGMIGTSRPTHYHVLIDEIGFSVNDLQGLVHSLSYVYQRSTTAISVVAPIRYAHLAASQMGQFMKFDDSSSSSQGLQVPQIPKLHPNVSSSMFFC